MALPAVASHAIGFATQARLAQDFLASWQADVDSAVATS
jgi:hypothetical protein